MCHMFLFFMIVYFVTISKLFENLLANLALFDQFCYVMEKYLNYELKLTFTSSLVNSFFLKMHAVVLLLNIFVFRIILLQKD